ncbi:hypothetical protein [Escherichia coli]|uniref:hypothetical protein n=1 Tax=Escherichia coli TaxID=562 RepID=UPI003315A293
MAALMKQRQVMVYTHDSIGLGEDGPTHQPVEQVASLRVTRTCPHGVHVTRLNPRSRGNTALSVRTARLRLSSPVRTWRSRNVLKSSWQTSRAVVMC